MASPRVVVVIVDGLPVELLESELAGLPFIRERLPYSGTAVSCFPSTTGPAYFPFLAGSTPRPRERPGHPLVRPDGSDQEPVPAPRPPQLRGPVFLQDEGQH